MDSEPAVSKTIVINKITTATTATRTMRITERPLWFKFEDRCGFFFFTLKENISGLIKIGLKLNE